MTSVMGFSKAEKTRRNQFLGFLNDTLSIKEDSMPKKYKNSDQTELLNIRERLSTAPCVLPLRNALETWRAGANKGVKKTTRELSNFWFFNDHKLPKGTEFSYYLSQREAIETLHPESFQELQIALYHSNNMAD